MPSAIRTFAAFLILAALALGCGTKEKPVASVSGKVTYNNKTVPQGSVTFVGEDGGTGTATIADGVYTMERAPVGKVKVSVITPSASGLKQGMKQKVEGKSFEGTATGGIDVPGRFANADSSGLSLTVPAEGSTTLDIAIPK